MAGRTSSSTPQAPKLRLGEAEIVRMGLGTTVSPTRRRTWLW